MKKTFFILMIACLVLNSFNGYADLEVTTDVNHQKDFENFKTFAWLSDDLIAKRMNKQPNPVIDKSVKEAVTQNLIEKGYVEAPFDQADLIVTYSTSLEHKEEVENAGFGMGRNYYGSRVQVNQFGNVRKIPDMVWDNHAYTNYFSEGKLILDFYERKSKELVWRGTGMKVFEGMVVTMENPKKDIAKYVKTMMKEFPA